MRINYYSLAAHPVHGEPCDGVRFQTAATAHQRVLRRMHLTFNYMTRVQYLRSSRRLAAAAAQARRTAASVDVAAHTLQHRRTPTAHDLPALPAQQLQSQKKRTIENNAAA